MHRRSAGLPFTAEMQSRLAERREVVVRRCDASVRKSSRAFRRRALRRTSSAQDLFCAFQGGAAGGEGSAVTFFKIHQFYSHTIEGLLAKPAGARRRIHAAQGTCAGYEHGDEGAAAARF